jgi:hypothetical protein
MADRPIIYSAPMIRALLDGRKTMTRHVLKPQPRSFTPNVIDIGVPHQSESGEWGQVETIWSPPSFASPRGEPLREEWRPLRLPAKTGDRMWVRENHQFRGADYGDSYGEIEWFRCYGGSSGTDSWDPDFPDGFSPSDHDAVRLLTEPDEQEGDGIKGYVTRLRPSIHMPRWASRLTLIVEGVKVERLQDISEADAIAEGALLEYGEDACISARRAFELIWKHRHGEDAWTANPFVAAITSRPIRANIDTLDAQGRTLVCEEVTP